MKDSICIIGQCTMILFFKAHIDIEDILKKAFILFDRILYEPADYTYDEKNNLVDSGNEVSSFVNSEERSFLRNNKQFKSAFIKTNELLSDKNAYSEHCEYHKNKWQKYLEFIELIKKDQIQSGINYDYQNFRNWLISGDGASLEMAIQDFATYESINRFFPSASGLISPYHQRAINFVPHFLPTLIDGLNRIEEIDNLEMPSFSELPWHHILELRNEDLIKSFRIQLRGLLNDLHGGENLENVKRRLLNDIWNLIHDVEPRLGKSVITGILGNIPLPFPNPVSIANSVNDLERQYALKKNMGGCSSYKKRKNYYVKMRPMVA